MNEFNLNNKIFRSVSNTENGEVTEETIFKYFQENTIIWAEYQGGDIIKGTIIGEINENNTLTFSYQHINQKKELCTGKCHSTPEITASGKLLLNEKWQWTCKDFSSGESVIEEV